MSKNSKRIKNKDSSKDIKKKNSSIENIKNTSIDTSKDKDKDISISNIGTPLDNPIHERFCQLYSKTFNATRAYLQARQGLNGEEFSIDSARTIGNRLLTQVDIRIRLSEIADHTAQSLNISRSDIVEGIQNEITADPIDVFTWEGDTLILKSLKDIPAHVRQTIKGLKQNKDGQIEVTFYDKQRAREQLMKYLGMLSDKVDINITHELGKELAAAHQRVIKRSSGINAPGEVAEAEYTEID